MSAIETAKKIIEKFGTNDVLLIAERSNVPVVYGDWHPATVGEFDRKTRTICVNRRAVVEKKYSERAIIAHELGHFFAAVFNLDKKSEEIFACEFAGELLKAHD